MCTTYLHLTFQVEEDSETHKYVKLLKVFAYGTFQDYVSQADSLPPLTLTMSKKLKCLSIVTLSSQSKVSC